MTHEELAAGKGYWTLHRGARGSRSRDTVVSRGKANAAHLVRRNDGTTRFLEAPAISGGSAEYYNYRRGREATADGEASMRNFRERHYVHLRYYLGAFAGLEILIFMLNHGNL